MAISSPTQAVGLVYLVVGSAIVGGALCFESANTPCTITSPTPVTILPGSAALLVVGLAIGWYGLQNGAIATPSPMALQKRDNPRQSSLPSPQPVDPSVGRPYQGPITTPHPRIVVGTMQIPNAGALSIAYQLTPGGTQGITGYTDEIHWNVVAGSLVSNPMTGVIITYYWNPNANPTQHIYQVPNSGPLTVVGFHGSMIQFSSPRGTATFDLTTRTVTWTPGSST